MLSVQAPLTAPLARIVVVNNDRDSPAAVTYVASTQDLNGVVIAQRWRFDDGTVSDGLQIAKAYAEAGTCPTFGSKSKTTTASWVTTISASTYVTRASCRRASSRRVHRALSSASPIITTSTTPPPLRERGGTLVAWKISNREKVNAPCGHDH